jgi:hypothetical protein
VRGRGLTYGGIVRRLTDQAKLTRTVLCDRAALRLPGAVSSKFRHVAAIVLRKLLSETNGRRVEIWV